MTAISSEVYEARIGLEIHVQLRTRTKMFCGCRVEFGAPPNTNVCPVCLGLPGALPAINARAVELAVRAALALRCRVHERSTFTRKNYFYPDLPKGYQITQYADPLATDGELEVPGGPGPSDTARVRIRRAHLEEDAGKSVHDRFVDRTALDLNRAGTPLLEIVTEPDLRAPVRARALLVRLKRLLEYLDVSDCHMEEGSLRVDANLSVQRRGAGMSAGRTELKNMNSFRQLEEALEYERRRQVRALEAGDSVERQTLLWDADRRQARPLRGKEDVEDYRYFPEPDLPPLRVSPDLVQGVRSSLPELPWQRERRLKEEHGLPEYDVGVLTRTRELADYYEELVREVSDPKLASNWVMGEVLAACNASAVSVSELAVGPSALAELLAFVEDGTLSDVLARRVFRRMLETGRSASRIVDEEGLRTVTDHDRLQSWVRAVLESSAEEVERYRAGERRLIDYLIGQVMRRSSGRADPREVRALLEEFLAEGGQ